MVFSSLLKVTLLILKMDEMQLFLYYSHVFFKIDKPNGKAHWSTYGLLAVVYQNRV